MYINELENRGISYKTIKDTNLLINGCWATTIVINNNKADNKVK